MPLPENFNEFEHLQDMVRREHNKAVQAYFKKQQDNDINTPKAALKHACLLKDEDTATMTLMRQWLFEFNVGHAQSLQAPIYGIPVSEQQTNFKFKPQIKLYFKEPYNTESVKQGLPQATAEITFRLMQKSSETISRIDTERLALDIKKELATPIFSWEKGHFICTYYDDEKGYKLRLQVKSKLEGERVVKKILSIQEHIFNDDKFQFVENTRTYPAIPGTHKVYGRTVKKPRERPVTSVKFRYAQLLIWGQQNAVNLVSVAGRLRSVIQRV